MSDSEKSFVAKISDRLTKAADLKGQIVCNKCSAKAPFLGMRQYCLNCKAELDASHRADQLSLALEYISVFIDECDESLGIGKNAILNAISQYKKKIEDTGTMLNREDLAALKNLLRDLKQIGGNECGAAIQIPKQGKFTIAMRQENGMTSGDAADLIVKIMMALLFIDQMTL